MNQPLDIPQLLELRKKTRTISQFLSEQLNVHLETLMPLFNPRSVFGRHIRGADKSASKRSDEAFAELEALYRSVNKGHPLNLRDNFDRPMDLTRWAPVIHPLQYVHEAADGETQRKVTITRPLRWAVTYADWGPDRLRQLIAGQSKATGHDLEQCVLHYLMLHVTLKRQPGIARVFESLRLPLGTETFKEFGEIPITVIDGPVATFRPPDDIIIQSTEVSGATLFEEVVSTAAVDELADPLREKLESLMA